MFLVSHEILCPGNFSNHGTQEKQAACTLPVATGATRGGSTCWRAFGGATLLGERQLTADTGEGGSRWKTWLPGDTGTGIHMVMEGRGAQCFSSVTTVKGGREIGFYKELSRGLHSARKSICRGGTCEVTGPFLW